MNKIIVFGVGVVARYIYNKIDLSNNKILGFVNPYTFNTDTIKEFEGYPVFGINEINDLNYDFLLIASGNISDVKNKIVEVGLDINKAVAFMVDFDNDAFFSDLSKEINRKYAEFLNDKHMNIIVPSYERNKFFPVSMEFSSNANMHDNDFVRYKQLELIAQSIYNNGIEGSVAECGVYKGKFSKKINECFPDRNLYLFDTFEGFDERSIRSEMSMGGGGVNVPTHYEIK